MKAGNSSMKVEKILYF